MTTERIDGQEVGFGRVAVPDSRDGLFPLRAAIPPTAPFIGVKVWDYQGDSLNQGSEGTCVGHGWKHFHACDPFKHSPTSDPTAVQIYDEACLTDEFPGNDPTTPGGTPDRSYGTSVRAGAKVLLAKGIIKEFRHAQSMQDVIDWLGTQGPLVIGVNWYEGMSYRSQYEGSLIVPKGRIMAGHCVLVQGVDTEITHAYGKGAVVIRNSWGPTWGPWGNGMAHIAFEHFNRLVFSEGGDCLAALEVAIGPTPPPPSGLTFEDAENAAVAEYNGMAPGRPYNATYYQKKGAKRIVDAIARRKAQG